MELVLFIYPTESGPKPETPPPLTPGLGVGAETTGILTTGAALMVILVVVVAELMTDRPAACCGVGACVEAINAAPAASKPTGDPVQHQLSPLVVARPPALGDGVFELHRRQPARAVVGLRVRDHCLRWVSVARSTKRARQSEL